VLKISPVLEKLENRLEKIYDENIREYEADIKKRLPSAVGGLYLYSIFVNSVKLGIASTFARPGTEPIKNIFVLNPIKNFLALFSPAGLGVTFFFVIMFILMNKKAYKIFSGNKSYTDKRGFDIVPDGTHGTSGFMNRNEMSVLLDIGKVTDTTATILGKLQETTTEFSWSKLFSGRLSKKNNEYISPKDNNGLNEHYLVYGASGAGKSRGFVKPFILQCAQRKESIVLVDPKGEFYESMYGYLRNEGYEVKAFNLLDMENSDGWNCMRDIETDLNLVQSISEVIIRNTSNANERQDFWAQAEQNLLMALIHYVAGLKHPGAANPLPIDQRSLGLIYKLLSTENFEELDKRIFELPGKHPAKLPYGIFKMANRQIHGNIAIGLGNRLGVFQNELVDKITKYDEIDLELPGKKPCAYFCIISDQDSSLEFLSSLLFSTLFARLTNYARRSGNNGRLPVKVNICLDEFCNVGKILDFKKIISTVRSRNINCQVIIQSVAQLADRYPGKEWEEIVANADNQIFLGCNDQMTAKFISDKCGSVSIQVTNNTRPVTPLFSPINSSTRPYAQSTTNTSRALMMPDEVLRLPNSQCLIFLRGQKPLLINKIIPDELPAFNKLRNVRVTEYLPEWRKMELAEKKKYSETEIHPEDINNSHDEKAAEDLESKSIYSKNSEDKKHIEKYSDKKKDEVKEKTKPAPKPIVKPESEAEQLSCIDSGAPFTTGSPVEMLRDALTRRR